MEAAQPSSEAQVALDRLEVADGVNVELFATEPLLYNPVAFSIDEKGRFFISETHRYKTSIFDIWAADQRWKDRDASFRTVEDRANFLAEEFASNPEKLTKDSEIIRLVEDRNGDGQADSSSIFADGFNEAISGTAAGVLARDGEVWFTNIPDLWRFEIDEAGNAKTREVLHTGYGVHIGVSGHDLHGLVMGPDGKLYFSIGDRGARVTTQEGKVLDSPDTGAVFRCEPDGSNLEVFAIGLRNPQELAFDRYGNLWAHDNDTAGADKSRVIHVVEGGDYGWRYSYQFMDGFGPWVQEKVWAGAIDDVLPNAGYGAQGPAGLAYYPGVGLPDRYDDHFLACDFPQGVWAFSVEPKGASYKVDSREKFMWSAGPTDVAFGPDGDVYISDWGRSYQMPDAGRIYRISDSDDTNAAAKAELKDLLNDGIENSSLGELAEHLRHADMRVRQAAQFRLIKAASTSPGMANTVSDLLQKVARDEANLMARIHAVWGLEALLPENARETVAHLLDDPDAEIRAQAAKLIGSSSWNDFAPALTELLADSNSRVRFHAASSLRKIARADSAVNIDSLSDALFKFLRENDNTDAYLTHAGMMALRDLANTGLLEKAADDSSPAVRRAALLAMRRLASADIVQFLDDAAPRLRREAARAINDVPIDDAMPDLAALLPEENLPAEMLSRIINANFRTGGEKAAERLASFAGRRDVPAEFRVEAISALSDWATPAPRDRVVGLWRPLAPREPDEARAALVSIAKDILQRAPEELQVALVEAGTALEAKEITGALFDLLREPDASVALRQAIPATLIKLDFPRLSEMIEIVLADENLSVRRSGIELLDQVEVANAAALLGRLLEKETDLRLSQAAIATLGRIDEPDTDSVIATLMDRLLAGELRDDLHLDLLEAADKRSSSKVEEKLQVYRKSRSDKDSLAQYRAALVGGDAGLGKKVFFERDEVGCLRCHAVGGEGGNVGPDLTKIGEKRTREHLLQSIVEPNEHFAPGYERIVLKLKNGETVSGIVEKETENQIVLQASDQTMVKKSEIEIRHPAISAMPANLKDFLTDRELRDLIEYLTTLK